MTNVRLHAQYRWIQYNRLFHGPTPIEWVDIDTIVGNAPVEDGDPRGVVLPPDDPTISHLFGHAEREQHWHYYDPADPITDPTPQVTFDKEATRVRLMKQNGKAFFGFKPCGPEFADCVL